VPVKNFKAAWDAMDAECEVSGSYGLDAAAGGVPQTVEAMIAHMGMFVAEGTDLVAPNARSHTLTLSGELSGGHKALLRISFGLDASGATVMKVVTRAGEKEISEVLDEIVQSV
jgi:coatomer subunit gamma